MIMWYAQVTDRSRPVRFGVVKIRISANTDVYSVSPHISGLETMRSHKTTVTSSSLDMDRLLL